MVPYTAFSARGGSSIGGTVHILEGTALGVSCGTVFPLRFRSTAVWLSVVDMLCGNWRTGSLPSARRIDK
jgi:hypothetical protein